MNFSERTLKNDEFNNCIIKYGNFSESSLANVIFNDCNLQEAAFMNLKKINKVVFNNCDMQKTDFFKTNLNKIDLRTCNLDGIRLSLECLNGVIVTSYQAIGIAGILGINIKEIGEN